MSEPDINKPRIALLGIPIEIGASQAGTLMGPARCAPRASAACSNNSDLTSRIMATWLRQRMVAPRWPGARQRQIL